MQMQSVDTSAGTAICRSAFQDGVALGMPLFEYRSMFSMVTVASSTRMPTAGPILQGHDVDGFSEKAEDHDGRQDG